MLRLFQPILYRKDGGCLHFGFRKSDMLSHFLIEHGNEDQWYSAANMADYRIFKMEAGANLYFQKKYIGPIFH